MGYIMKLKKNIYIFLLLFILFPLQAVSVPRSNGLQTIKTKYFDIIYPPESETTANLFLSFADDIYIKACESLGNEKYFRMPVLITPSYDSLNAYFTVLPYNRIVVYDTLPFSNDTSSLAVFSETLQSVFYHELIHAVSLNMKTPFFKGLSYAFGDYFNPALIYLPTMFIEGAAVAFESADGEGRLNNGFSLHLVKQAKLENKFPSWQDAAGSKDIYPSGTIPYMFGGTFTSWLLEKYGSEKYTEFLYECGKLHITKMIGGIFKKIYKQSLKDAWNEFYESIEIDSIYTDLSNFGMQEQNLINKKNELYRSLVSCDKGFAWINMRNSSVYWLSKDDILTGEKPKKLFTWKGLSSISLSEDGKYIAASVTDDYDLNIGFLYSIPEKKIIYLPDIHLRDIVIVKLSDESFYAAGVYIQNQKTTLKFYKIEDTISSTSSYSYELPNTQTVYSLIGLQKGFVAFISGEKSNKITLFNPVEKICKEFSVENISDLETFSIKNLSAILEKSTSFDNHNFNIAFSWTTKNTLPRLGICSIDFSSTEINKSFFLLGTQDFSGGFYTPVFLDENTILYSAHFFDYDKLLSVDFSLLDFNLFQVKEKSVNFNYEMLDTSLDKKNENNDAEDIVLNKSNSSLAILDSKKYNPLKYLLKGTLIPTVNYTEYNYKLENIPSVLLGGTFFTMDPAESFILMLGGGFNFTQKNWNAGLYFDAGGFKLNSSVFFDSQGFISSNAISNISLSIPFEPFYNISLENATLAFIGSDKELQENLIFSMQNTLGIKFSSFRKFNYGYYNTIGFSVGGYYSYLFSNITNQHYNNLALDCNFRIPGAIPISVYASLFPSSKSFVKFNAIFYFFTWEIQNAIPFIPLYLNRLAFSGGYVGDILRDNESWSVVNLFDILGNIRDLDYIDKVFLKIELFSSINTGIITGYQFSLSSTLEYNFRETDNKIDFTFGGKILL